LRILTVAHGYPPHEHAGAELAAHWLDRALLERGHAVRAFVRGGGRDVPALARLCERVDGVPVTRIATAMARATSLRDTYVDAGVRAAFERELAAGADVVHFHHTIGLSIDMVAAAKAAGARVVFTLHDFWHLCPRGQRYTPRGEVCATIDPAKCARCIRGKRVRWGLNRLVRAPVRHLLALPGYLARNLGSGPLRRRTAEIVTELNRADVVTAPSRFVLDEHVRHGLDPARACVVPNGIDLAVAKELVPHDAPHRPLRFGYVGSLLPSKGVDLLLAAFRGVGARGATLEIHGTSPWDGGRFERDLASANRDPAVRFHGRFGRDQFAAVLGSLDVLVLPSRWYENAPITLDEAAFGRLPVIVAGHGGMAELLAARENGLAFTPGDVTSLRAALTRFLDEPNLWHRLRAPAAPVPTAPEVAARFETLYRNG
jgi:glycosyltransferase involved in cell wall biosynthesis